MSTQTSSPIRVGSVEIGIDCNDPESLAPFWSLATGYAIGDFDPAGIYLDLVPPRVGLPVIYLQRVTEPKVAKNRLHIDLYVDDLAGTIVLLIAAGASRIGDVQSGSAGGQWQVMADPEGNEFCLCQGS